MFAYCLNNPVNCSDSLGSRACPIRADSQKKIGKWIDDFAQGIVNRIAPIGTGLLEWMHYNRNALNKAPKTESEAIDQGYVLLDEKDDKFHQNNQDGGRNKKYVSSDGHSEVVFYHNGKINDTPEDRGTYNVGSSVGNFIERYVVHGIIDVLPYMIWGNDPEDSTTILDRLIMVFQ